MGDWSIRSFGALSKCGAHSLLTCDAGQLDVNRGTPGAKAGGF